MPATMTKAENDAAILGTFRLLELDRQLDNVAEDLEKTAPQIAGNFTNFSREFSYELRNRVLRLVKENIGDHRVKDRIVYALRLADDALRQEREELKSKFLPEDAAIAREHLDTLERYLRDLKMDIANVAVEVWGWKPKVTA